MSFKELVELIKMIIPFVMEIIRLLKGQPSANRVKVVEAGKKAMRKQCMSCTPKNPKL